jgi:hypothetical protein
MLQVGNSTRITMPLIAVGAIGVVGVCVGVECVGLGLVGVGDGVGVGL